MSEPIPKPKPIKREIAMFELTQGEEEKIAEIKQVYHDLQNVVKKELSYLQDFAKEANDLKKILQDFEKEVNKKIQDEEGRG